MEEESDHDDNITNPEFDENPDELVEGTGESGEDYAEQSEEEELLCDDCINASTMTGNVDLCANCGPSGTNYEPRQNRQNPVETDETGENIDEVENGLEKANKGFQDDSEAYRAWDVSRLLIDYRHDLETFKELECPADMIQKQRILVDALILLESSLQENE